jgi:hypothetical protein
MTTSGKWVAPRATKLPASSFLEQVPKHYTVSGSGVKSAISENGALFCVPGILQKARILERFLDHNKPVRIRIDVHNRVTEGAVESANVVGEIPGTERPEQVVVVGGHGPRVKVRPG